VVTDYGGYAPRSPSHRVSASTAHLSCEETGLYMELVASSIMGGSVSSLLSNDIDYTVDQGLSSDVESSQPRRLVGAVEKKKKVKLLRISWTIRQKLSALKQLKTEHHNNLTSAAAALKSTTNIRCWRDTAQIPGLTSPIAR